MKHLQKLADKAKQRAEVSMYFKRFDEAEQSYHKMDRPDLAIDMRMRLGGRVMMREVQVRYHSASALLPLRLHPGISHTQIP